MKGEVSLGAATLGILDMMLTDKGGRRDGRVSCKEDEFWNMKSAKLHSRPMAVRLMLMS